MEKNVVFVMGPGRCGSRSIAYTFDKLPDVLGTHELDPPLVDLAVHRLYGVEPPFDPKEFLRERRVEPLSKRTELHYLDSAVWNTFLIPDILDVWPNAKFIILQRNIETWYRSTFRRGWYYPKVEIVRAESNPGVMYALRPEPEGGWEPGTSRAFKLGWYYALYHHYPKTVLAKCGKEHLKDYLYVAMEDLSHLNTMKEIQAWCGFPGKLEELAYKNSGSTYLLSKELRDAGLWPTGRAYYGDDFPVFQVSKISSAAEGLAKYIHQNPKPLTQREIYDLGQGRTYFRSRFGLDKENLSVQHSRVS